MKEVICKHDKKQWQLEYMGSVYRQKWIYRMRTAVHFIKILASRSQK